MFRWDAFQLISLFRLCASWAAWTTLPGSVVAQVVGGGLLAAVVGF